MDQSNITRVQYEEEVGYVYMASVCIVIQPTTDGLSAVTSAATWRNGMTLHGIAVYTIMKQGGLTVTQKDVPFPLRLYFSQDYFSQKPGFQKVEAFI